MKALSVTAIGLAALTLVLNHHALAENVSHADKSFIDSATESGLTEINASKIELQKSRNQDVKDFATMMIDNHTTMGDKLKMLAASKNIVPPTEPGMMQKAKIAILEKLDGPMFDKQYASMIGVSAHEDAVSLFSKTAREARDPGIRDFAAKSLTGLQRHLDMAMSLKTRVDAQKYSFRKSAAGQSLFGRQAVRTVASSTAHPLPPPADHESLHTNLAAVFCLEVNNFPVSQPRHGRGSCDGWVLN